MMPSCKLFCLFFMLMFVGVQPATLLADLDDFESKPQDKAQKTETPSAQQPDLGSKETVKKPSGQSPISDDLPQAEPEETKKPGAKPTKKTNKPAAQSGDDQPHDSKQPIEWSALGLKGTRNGKTIDLTKNVVVTQGDVRMEADHARIFFNANDEVDKVVADGNVKMNRKAENPKDRISARANEAIFYNQERKVILKGRATLARGTDIVRGQEISYNLDTGWITVDKVEGVVRPAEKPSVPSKDPSPKSPK